MICPHCGWKLVAQTESVNREGYQATMVCDTMINNKGACPIVIHANTDLLWAYENGQLPLHLRTVAHDILLSTGMLSTPP
tara:strand:+ start:394 stop:633 length:240 start_codon:yes stop_codon:yes gene_type:complete